jgi:hypothetical protein
MFAHPLQVDLLLSSMGCHAHKARTLLTGSDLLDQAMALVTIISFYMVEEFALSIVKHRNQRY